MCLLSLTLSLTPQQRAPWRDLPAVRASTGGGPDARCVPAAAAWAVQALPALRAGHPGTSRLCVWLVASLHCLATQQRVETRDRYTLPAVQLAHKPFTHLSAICTSCMPGMLTRTVFFGHGRYCLWGLPDECVSLKF